jgi:HAD superfamily hydrolase (TIGR01509 family)
MIMQAGEYMIRLVIFDVDGVIVQTETLFMEFVMEDLDRQKIRYTKNDISKIMGTNNHTRTQVMDSLFGDQQAYRDWDKVIHFHPERIVYPELMTEHLRELLSYLKEENIICSICTNSQQVRTERLLKELDLEEYFDGIYSGSDLHHSKPDPYMYELAMQEHNVLPEETIVLEDSSLGIQAGRNSGAYTIALRDRDGLADQREADIIIRDLMEVKEIVEKR